MISVKPANFLEFEAAKNHALDVYKHYELKFEDGMMAVRGDRYIYGVFQFHELGTGVAEVSAVLTRHIHLIPIAFVRRIHRCLRSLSLDYHRIQIVVRSDYAAGQRFAEALGFYKETVMKMYNADKTDSILYVRLS